jgi:hypothetical protein
MGTFWKIHFINPPEAQAQAVSLREKVGYVNRKIAQNREGVKLAFDLAVGFFSETGS